MSKTIVFRVKEANNNKEQVRVSSGTTANDSSQSLNSVTLLPSALLVRLPLFEYAVQTFV